jgi:hypothetical protein
MVEIISNKAEMTTIKVEKPLVEWLNSLKGYLEWHTGKKYTLNTALTIIIASYDVKNAIFDGLLDEKSDADINKYVQKRLKQFWENTTIPDIHWGHIHEAFESKK